MTCRVCGRRQARRHCPALQQRICSVCCGTKRLQEIACPSDCQYLATARAHPAAIVRRQQEDDLRAFLPTVRDLNQRQEQLMSRVLMFLRGYRGDALLRATDDDVQAAAAALAATYETAARGLIYEERPASLPAQRLVSDLQPLLTQLTEGVGTSINADFRVIFRAIERGAREARKTLPGGSSAYLDLLTRLIAPAPSATFQTGAPGPSQPATAPSLIVRP